MKGKLLLIFLMILSIAPSFAQKPSNGVNRDNRRKEMMEFKLNFLADEMDLTEAQKKQFNEVYTQMENERRAVFKKIKSAEKIISENKNASEADYDKANRDIANAKSQMSQIEKNYNDKFSKFLSKKQIYKMKEAEEKFTTKMRQCRDKKRNNK